MTERDAIWRVTARLGSSLDRGDLGELLDDAGLEVMGVEGAAQPRARVRALRSEMALLVADHGRSVLIEPDPIPGPPRPIPPSPALDPRRGRA